MACFIELSTNHNQRTYVNVEQVQVVRKATRFERDGRNGPITTIILQNELKVYVDGYETAIMKQLRECSPSSSSKIGVDEKKDEKP